MDSLTTAYVVCMLIGSISSFAAAFIGNKLLPIPSSSPEAAPPVQIEASTPSPPPQNTEQTQPVAPSTTS